MTEVIRPSLAVDTGEVRDLARRLRGACHDARRQQDRFGSVGTEVTGLSLLSGSLREHAAQWSWTLDLVEDRVRDIEYRLESGADAYERIDRCVASASTPDASQRG